LIGVAKSILYFTHPVSAGTNMNDVTSGIGFIIGWSSKTLTSRDINASQLEFSSHVAAICFWAKRLISSFFN
jgi:hypothetical protein